MNTIIKVENLVKIFYDKKNKKNIHAVDGISFELKLGEIFGLLGPNGAGKTTTIRILAGLLKPTSGHVYILGNDVENIGDRIRKKIGFLTELHGNYENLTVYENLRFFGSFYNIDDLDNRINEVLELMEISNRKNMKVGKLSKGLKQRAALARTLLHDPVVIFLDEPTAGLDPQAAFNVRNIILNLKSNKRLIFINSHNLYEVQNICTKVAILNKGKILRIGTAEELSKELFGSQEVNIETINEIDDFSIKELEKFDFIERVIKKDKIITIYLNNSQNHIPKIIKYLVNKNIDITEVVKKSHSLEDIYLTLIKESN